MYQGKLFTLKNGYHLQNLLPILCILFLFFVFWGCEEKIEKPGESTTFAQKLTCEGCHTDEATLKVLAPGIDEPPPSSGGG